MRKIKSIILGLAMAFSAVSCQHVLDVNTDPNNPTSANPEQLLPNAQVTLAAALDYQYVLVAAEWAQYWTTGTTIGLDTKENFIMVGGDISRSWNNTYARSLEDFYQLTKSGQPIYSGISKIMMAYTYQMLVDLHGDIPFTEALKGAIEDGGILTPKFDKPEDVYAALIPLIDEGLDEINNATVNDKKPGDDDILYAGDLAAWRTFANTLKLKILVRQCQADGSKLTEAYDLINSGATFIDETNPAQVYFSGASFQNSNPLWASFESRQIANPMYLDASQTSIDFLNGTSDPRISTIYYKGTDPDFVGIEQGEGNNVPYKATADTKYAKPNKTYVYANNLPVILLSAWESKFLQAEVMTREDDGGQEAMWNAGIEASFNYFGLGAGFPTFLSGLTFGVSENEQLKSIALQKWVSMNGVQMVEGWIETRRFDVESAPFIIFRGVGGIFHQPSQSSLADNQFPSLFVYGLNEASCNPNTPPNRKVTDKVFWDN